MTVYVVTDEWGYGVEGVYLNYTTADANCPEDGSIRPFEVQED